MSLPHQAVCTPRCWLYPGDSALLPFPVSWELPWGHLSGQAMGTELLAVSHLQPALAFSLSVNHCFIQAKSKRAHRKPLKCNRLSAETRSLSYPDLCRRTSCGFHLQKLGKGEDILPASSDPAQTPFPARPDASLSKYRDLNCNKQSQPFHHERLNLLRGKNDKS